jgi:hypothetical protein
MPTSHPYQLNQILEVVIKTKPKAILDIGTGFGKYGVLFREYLEYWSGSEDYERWTHVIDGIEVHEKYLTPLHSFIYDRIYTGEATKVIANIGKRYDLITLIDVIEHLSEEDGSALITQCLDISNNLLISTPKIMAEQSDAFDNPHETHVFQWTKEHFSRISGSIQIDPENDSLIFLIGKDSERFRPDFRTKMRKDWPAAYRFLKKICGKQ